MRTYPSRVALLMGVVLTLPVGCAEPASETGALRFGRLEIVDVQVLEGGVIPHPPNDLALADDQRIAAVFGRSVPPPWFDSSGLVVGQLGGFGEGPGEFGFPDRLLAVDDSIVVFDQRRRMSVIPLRGGAPRTIRSTSMRIRDAAVLEWPTRVVVAASPVIPTDSAPALMMLDLSGVEPHIYQWMDLHQNVDPFDSEGLDRVIAADPTSGFWSLDRYRYRLVQWDNEGQVVQSYQRMEPWAPDGTVGMYGGPQVAPTPKMGGLTVDSAGRPWTITHVPIDAWASVWQDYGITSLGGESLASQLPGQHEMYVSRLEILTPSLDSILVSEILPYYVTDVLSDGRFVRYAESDIGEPQLEVLTIRFGGGN